MNENQFRQEYIKRWGKEPLIVNGTSFDCLGECDACHPKDIRDLLSNSK